MTDTNVSHTEFTINQLRLQNLYQWMQFLAVAVMIIFTTSLLPSLLLRYVYTDPNMTTTPPVFEIIPVFSFVVGVVFFIYAGIGNIMREMRAVKLERSLMMPSVLLAPRVTPSSVKPAGDLQSAMKSLAAKSDTKRRTKTVAAQRTTARSTKTSRTTGRRKTK